MEACIENPGFVAGAAGPSWAIRVARPVGDGSRMAEELRGVPASALQRVFGRALGDASGGRNSPARTTPLSNRALGEFRTRRSR
jgi:hypothetical protein